MMVLGIDPGFSSLGWAVANVELDNFQAIACGVIRTEKASKKVQLRSSEDNIKRAQEILEQLRFLSINWNIRAISTESMSWPRNAGVVAKMGIVWGVIASVAHMSKLPMVQSSPMEIKRAFAGDGKASKERMIARCVELFPDLELPGQETLHEHAVDAIASIWAAKNSEAFKWALNANRPDTGRN